MSYKPNFDIKALLEAGVHFGHRKNHWNPEMAKYIYGVKNKAHIIDLKQSAHHLYNALRVMFTVASNKGKVLFVNTVIFLYKSSKASKSFSFKYLADNGINIWCIARWGTAITAAIKMATL